MTINGSCIIKIQALENILIFCRTLFDISQVFFKSTYTGIYANGIINVTAQDKATGKSQKVTITASTNLNSDEVDRMVDEAQAHA